MKDNLQNATEFLVSVIVPVYNVEKYLRECVDSVLAQTYKNLEVILVDDGSTDACPQICDEYAKKDNRVCVIHKKNGGLSDARNVGIENASGTYITFVDSDDIIDQNMISFLIKPIAADCDVEMSCCTFREFADGTNPVGADIKCDESEIHSYKELSRKFTWIISCAKLYKKSLFENIHFPIGRLHEDEFTTYKLCYEAKKIAWTDSKLYLYRKRAGSITNKKTIKNFSDTFDAFCERLHFFEERGEDEFVTQTVHEMLALMCALCKSDLKKSETSFITNKISKNIKPFYKRLSLKERIKIFLFAKLPFVFRLQARLRGTF